MNHPEACKCVVCKIRADNAESIARAFDVPPEIVGTPSPEMTCDKCVPGNSVGSFVCVRTFGEVCPGRRKVEHMEDETSDEEQIVREQERTKNRPQSWHESLTIVCGNLIWAGLIGWVAYLIIVAR
jgi:hypothetical protein